MSKRLAAAGYKIALRAPCTSAQIISIFVMPCSPAQESSRRTGTLSNFTHGQIVVWLFGALK